MPYPTSRTGRVPLSFAGIAGHCHPQYSARTHHVVALRDRIAECFFFSMNGRPPSYFGPDLIAIETYIAYLSRGAVVGPAPPKAFAYRPPTTISATAGKTIYAAQCAACHGATGAGNASAGFPPLWGARSFNDRAGMNRLMPAFVQAHMPLGRGGTLTDQQARRTCPPSCSPGHGRGSILYALRTSRPTNDVSSVSDGE